MTALLLFISAVLLMIVGHVFKVKRWGLFVSVYEEPVESNLLNAMSLGHTINAILPVRVGDVVRVLWAGNRLKNGVSFALATVFADLYIDVITVGAIALGLAIKGYGGDRLLNMAYMYGIAFIILVPFTAFCIFFRKEIKRIIRWIASVFNTQIEFRLLYITYLCIASIKDIVLKIPKLKFVYYSFAIWTGYIISYVLFAGVVKKCGYDYSISDVFVELFTGSSLYHIEMGLIPIWGAYVLVPLLVCFIISWLWNRKVQIKEHDFRRTLPQFNQADKLAFLRTYYEDERRASIQMFLGINRDVTILEDSSAGSNASTVVVMNNEGDVFYRKYAFDKDGEKLNEQIKWIETHQKDIPLPIIVNKRISEQFVTYDMHSYSNAVGLFRFIHTMTLDNSWMILENVLEDIKNNLHTNNRKEKVHDSIISLYIDQKVRHNIGILYSDKYIRTLEQYDTITINGRELKTLKKYSDILSKEHLTGVFENDCISDVHGDLTIENIVCLLDPNEIDNCEYEDKCFPQNYYLIDPNEGNILNSPNLDYGKLLQSLHGNYEFFMMVNDVKIEKRQVSFLITQSELYCRLYEMFSKYLIKEFSKDQIRSMYYHEIVHWLRLIPYKIRKDEKRAVVFYAGLLMVLNDVWDNKYETER